MPTTTQSRRSRQNLDGGAGGAERSESGTSGRMDGGTGKGYAPVAGEAFPDASSPPAPLRGDPRVEALGAALREAIRGSVARASEPRWTLLFSGGLDSSLVARIGQEVGEPPDLVTIGFPGSRDLERGRRSAEALGIPWRSVLLSPDAVRSARDEILRGKGLPPPRLLSVQVGMYLAVRAARTQYVLCGQGADELFLGYAHFRGLAAPEVPRRAQADWGTLVAQDWPTSTRLAALLGHRLASPFLDGSVQSVAMRFSWGERMGKAPLRALARSLGLPPEISEAPKTAMQYGTGIDRFLRRDPESSAQFRSTMVPDVPSREAPRE